MLWFLPNNEHGNIYTEAKKEKEREKKNFLKFISEITFFFKLNDSL